MTILLIAHGSPDPRHRTAMERLAHQVEAALGEIVRVGYLDHNSPSATEAVNDPDDQPTRAVGLLLTDGYHARTDIPEVLRSVERPVVNCGTLGLGEWLFPALERALGCVVGDDAAKSGVVLVAAGSSHPEARDEVVTLAARWQLQRGAPVRAAFATGSGPSVAEALSMLNDVGAPRRAIVPLLLAPGSMTDRIEELAGTSCVSAAPTLLDPANQQPPTELISRIVELCGGYNGQQLPPS